MLFLQLVETSMNLPAVSNFEQCSSPHMIQQYGRSVRKESSISRALRNLLAQCALPLPRIGLAWHAVTYKPLLAAQQAASAGQPPIFLLLISLSSDQTLACAEICAVVGTGQRQLASSRNRLPIM
jgi:hypothetical protein